MRFDHYHIIPLLLILLFGTSFGANKDEPEILIIGHRGAAGYAPENTLPSIKLAIELGANAIEIDLRQTKDGIPVALHDSDVERTTDSCGSISDYTFKDLQKLDAGKWFNAEFTGTKIPSLTEVAEAIPDSIILIIEFKGGIGEYKGIERRTLEIIDSLEITDQVILKSFDPNQLEFIKTLNNNVRLLYVYAVRIPWLNMIIDTGISFGSVYDLDVNYLQPHLCFLSESFVTDAHHKEYKVIAWGVNEVDEIEEAVEIGVDGIETDYPDRVNKLINK